MVKILHTKYLFLCLTFLLVVSGCVDKSQTQAENMDWNQTKYEEYSTFYEYLINDTRIAVGSMSSTHIQKLIFEIEEYLLMKMPSSKNEIEKIWYLAISNHQHGLEALVKAYGSDCSSAAMSGIPKYGEKDPSENRHREICRQNYLTWSKEAYTYFDKSYEYRQNIELWNPITPKGKEVTLNTGEKKFSTIQAAVNEANVGDVISVNEGVYYETIIVRTNGISIIGKNKETVILEDGEIMIEHANNVTITGFTINNSVGDNRDKGNLGDTLSSKRFYGIYLSYADNNTITKLNIINKPVGIGLVSSRYNKVSDNEIKSSNRYGMRFTNSINNMIFNNIFENNEVGVYDQNNRNQLYSNNFIDNIENIKIHNN